MISRIGLWRAAALLALLLAACDKPVSWSHVGANVPPAGEFHVLLARDVQTAFHASHGRGVKVEPVLLHDQPAQSGVALPKYYLWVTVCGADGKLLDEGAVRVAAVERKGFELLNFVPAQHIRANPADVERTFPPALADAIRARAGARLPAAANEQNKTNKSGDRPRP